MEGLSHVIGGLLLFCINKAALLFLPIIHFHKIHSKFMIEYDVKILINMSKAKDLRLLKGFRYDWFLGD